MHQSWVCIVALALVTGCASTLPRPIREPVVGAPSFAAVQANPAAHHEHLVRWGGTIVDVRNTATTTIVEILAKELGSWGRPTRSDAAQGRFLARFDGFVDPVIYDTGRQLTVYGPIVGAQRGLIGERPYVFPVVAVEVSHLWREDLYADAYPYGYGLGYWPFGYRGGLVFGSRVFYPGYPYYW